MQAFFTIYFFIKFYFQFLLFDFQQVRYKSKFFFVKKYCRFKILLYLCIVKQKQKYLTIKNYNIMKNTNNNTKCFIEACKSTLLRHWALTSEKKDFDFFCSLVKTHGFVEALYRKFDFVGEWSEIEMFIFENLVAIKENNHPVYIR